MELVAADLAAGLDAVVRTTLDEASPSSWWWWRLFEFLDRRLLRRASPNQNRDSRARRRSLPCWRRSDAVLVLGCLKHAAASVARAS